MIKARYTVVLKTLIDNPESKAEIDKALSTYPLYAQEEESVISGLIPTREQLNKKILDKYKYREIGFETVGRFLDELEITMCEIMPYYNQQMRTVDIMNSIEDPFGNVDFTETYKEERSGITVSEDNSTVNQNSNTHQENAAENEISRKQDRLTKVSDTPQNSIDDLDKYLSSATKEDSNDKDTTAENSSSDVNSNNETVSAAAGKVDNSQTVEHTFSKKGNQGVNTYAHDIIEYRQSLINIEQMIINDSRLQELFMLVY